MKIPATSPHESIVDVASTSLKELKHIVKSTTISPDHCFRFDMFGGDSR